LTAAQRLLLSAVCHRAPTLFRRFGAAGEVAVDLLARLLTFDPARRCGCEEALAHEYFEELRDTLAGEGGGDPVAAVAAVAGRQGASTGGCAQVWLRFRRGRHPRTYMPTGVE
jgi:hypothetical protein